MRSRHGWAASCKNRRRFEGFRVEVSFLLGFRVWCPAFTGRSCCGRAWTGFAWTPCHILSPVPSFTLKRGCLRHSASRMDSSEGSTCDAAADLARSVARNMPRARKKATRPAEETQAPDIKRLAAVSLQTHMQTTPGWQARHTFINFMVPSTRMTRACWHSLWRP